MNKPIFVYQNSQSIINFKDYSYINYTEHSSSQFWDNLRFLNNLNSVVIVNYPTLLWHKIKENIFKNPVVVISSLKSREGYKILRYGKLNEASSVVKKLTPTKVITNWYNYWICKGVLSKNIESKLYMLKWTYP